MLLVTYFTWSNVHVNKHSTEPKCPQFNFTLYHNNNHSYGNEYTVRDNVFELAKSIKDLLFKQGGRESFGNGP